MQVQRMVRRNISPVVRTPHLLLPRFGVAEQAINAIYLLGEQPEKVCDGIIKNLTSRVFNAPSEPVPSDNASDVEPPSPAARSEVGDTTMDVDDAATVTAATPRPKENTAATTDMGDAFNLSQLVFIVGHISIKHIVYLELIERELKRRKEASAKGLLIVRGLVRV
jgi:condensin complex subunit 1